MSRRYSEYIGSKRIPGFILTKNLMFEHQQNLDASITRGELIGYSSHFDELKKAIPYPGVPEDDYKLSLFDKKFGALKGSKAEFDDSPLDIHEGDPSDYEIFGESYTISWICLPDPGEVSEYLVERYKEKRDLIEIWDNYIDRMHVFPFYSLETSSDQFYENVCDLFEGKVNDISQPPSEKEWDILNDYL
ncbi:hypothetical protein GF385_02115 [Candidatus Dependentiae bacterium]|nr:hypothetical protein [Candidatus Dependentiae bacterium]